MKNREISITKSFRFKIIAYSLLSLVYAMLSEFVLIFIFKNIYQMFWDVQIAQDKMSYEFAMLRQRNQLALQSSNSSFQSIEPMVRKPFLGIFIFFLILIGIALFIIYFLLLTRKFSVYLKQIVNGINQIATGDLSTRIVIHDEDEFAFIAHCLNKMTDDISLLIENERKNEKVKNDLITNVAHDIRTPLTSIIGYLNLTIKNEDLEEETRKKYISVAYDKSLRLQKLIEDLFSYTKYNSEEVKKQSMPIDMVKFMEQMIEEFYPALEDAQLECEFSHNCENAIVVGDGDLLARAFSNLISNAIKYGKDGKNLRIFVNRNKSYVSISVVNYGEVIPIRGFRIYI